MSKNIVISVFVSIVFLVVYILFEDRIKAAIKTNFGFIRNFANATVQSLPTDDFNTEFGKCNVLTDVDFDKLIDIENRGITSSCEVGLLQKTLNDKKGANLLVNGNMDSATRDQLLINLDFVPSFNEQSLNYWLESIK